MSNFSPEEQKAYDEEMQRLEAEAAKDTGVKTDAKAATTTEGETVEALKARLEVAEKAIKDNQAWGTRNAQEVKRLKEEQEKRQREASRPAILDANPGLEDAISHVAGTKDKPTDEQVWLKSMETAIPDLETLLSDPVFQQKAQARREQVGADWANPLIAIREISDLKVSHLRDKAVTAASEQARKDFEAKARKRPGMEVPGGSGGKDSKSTDEGERFRTMSKADFDKERSRVMGY